MVRDTESVSNGFVDKCATGFNADMVSDRKEETIKVMDGNVGSLMPLVTSSFWRPIVHLA